MDLLSYYGMTPRGMHDPDRLVRRAAALVAEANRELRVAHLLFQRAREVREGEQTWLRVPTVFDSDYLGGLIVVVRREPDGPLPSEMIKLS